MTDPFSPSWSTPRVGPRSYAEAHAETHADVLPAPQPGRSRRDALGGLVAGALIVLLGAPVGLLWAAVAPRLQITITNGMPEAQDVEGKAFIGADGTFFVITLAVGLLCGLAVWFLGRRSGPWAVAALLVGSFLAALVALRVGHQVDLDHVFRTLSKPPKTGTLDFFLGKRTKGSGGTAGDSVTVRSKGILLAWPLGAVSAFLVPALRRPHELD